MVVRRFSFTIALFLVACSSSASPPDSSNDAGSTNDGGSTGGPADAAASGDTWDNYAAGFFTTYCTECHNPQDSTGRDYNLQVDVAKDKVAMRCGVATKQDPAWSCAASPTAKQFPIGTGPKPTDAERDRIVAWIAAGEP